MSKQDRQGPRTPADLERKHSFGKRFAEFLGIALDAQKSVEEANKIISSINETVDGIELNVKKYDENMQKVEAELKLTIKEDDKSKIVSMINAAADVIHLKSNRLTIDSMYFKLTALGEVTASKVNIKSEGTNHSVHIGDGRIRLESPPTEAVNMDDSTSKALLMEFKVNGSDNESKNFGVYAYGEWRPKYNGTDISGIYWHPSGSIAIEEIPQSL